MKPGHRMPDGTIYAGVSPDTGKPIYAMPADPPSTMTFTRAMEYAKRQRACHHRDWRLPTKNELNVLFNNRAAIGGFTVNGPDYIGWYLSSSPSPPDRRYFLWGQRFNDDRGPQWYLHRSRLSSVRCVRGAQPKP